MKIRAGDAVVVYLKEPRERIWGVLRSLDDAGVMVEGFELDSFDSWLGCVIEGSSWRSQIAVLFFPMARVQRVSLDRGDETAPSMAERFETRVGQSIERFLDPGDREPS